MLAKMPNNLGVNLLQPKVAAARKTFKAQKSSKRNMVGMKQDATQIVKRLRSRRQQQHKEIALEAQLMQIINKSDKKNSKPMVWIKNLQAKLEINWRKEDSTRSLG